MTIHHGMTYSDYERLPGWRWSHIKLLHDRSPRHVQHALRTPDEDTPSRRWLRAVHCLALEMENFGSNFAVFSGVRRGKAFDAFAEEHKGKAILNEREEDEAIETARAIREHDAVRALLADGKPEVVVTWEDEATGLPCKARLDWLCNPGHTHTSSGIRHPGLLDLKTLGTTHEDEVARLIESRLYHGQLAHYAAGLRAHDIEVPVFLVAAEGKGAQDVAVFRLDDRPPDGPLHIGAEIRADLMRQLAECVERDHWPGRHESVHDITIREAEGPDPDDVLTFGKEQSHGD